MGFSKGVFVVEKGKILTEGINNMIRIKLLFSIFAFFLISPESKAQVDTLFAENSQNEQLISWNHKYHETMTMKLFLAQAEFDGKYKRKDNGNSTVFLTFAEALEVIKKIDNLTLGIPKIVYLVGWQYNGHDSKYPAWFGVNERLKRAEDDTAIESLKWLMHEAKQYHTTVSLHINMFDAYLDSPLWDTYVEHDIIARKKDGELKEGEWGYPISYAQEVKTGFAQKRIDSLCNLLPIENAGTIHIDAFHSWAPIGERGPGKGPFIKEPISPYLGFSVEDEINAQKEIFKYWASKGVDVTSETATFLRDDDFAGLQPMTWWVDWKLEDYLTWPASFYTGGEDRRVYGKIFGSNAHGEPIIRNDPEKLTGFKKDFCTKTVIWYYLNQHERKFVVRDQENYSLHLSDNLISRANKEERTISQGDLKLVENADIFMPAPWVNETTFIAYSENGYQDKQWDLPEDWKSYTKAGVWEIPLSGKEQVGEVVIQGGKIILSLEPDQMVIIIPGK